MREETEHLFTLLMSLLTLKSMLFGNFFSFSFLFMEIFIPEVESFYKREKYLQTF